MVFRKNTEGWQVLLIQRKNNPYQYQWAFPGGFVDMDETVEEAASRELKEETGLEGVELRQFYTFSAPDRDPRGRTVSVVFYGFAEAQNSEVHGSDDAQSAQWHNLHQLPKLAFDHDQIIKKALDELSLW
jgi:8-oxo-dGTP diphosphatase